MKGSRVHWGETAALELGPTDSLGYTLHHAVLLTGLGAGQSYLFDVESTGLAGGSARDDLGGATPGVARDVRTSIAWSPGGVAGPRFVLPFPGAAS